MEDNIVRYPEVYNPYNEDCRICEGLNYVYHPDFADQKMKLPEYVGNGYCKKIMIKPNLGVSIVDMTFSRDFIIRGQGEYNDNFYDLSFCLEGDFRWKTDENSIEYEANSDDNFILNGKGTQGISNFKKGQHFSYISFRMEKNVISPIFHRVNMGDMLNTFYKSKELHKNKTSFEMKRILYDMVNCRMSKDIKKIYFEAKIIELLVVYINEVIFENQVIKSCADFSKEDIVRLNNAKNILDADIANAPCISRLAKFACLNEYKLKTGFKTIFGLSVHAYIIDRRLEEARFLLESKRCNVTEAANFVGYNELGRFAEKFRRKFGVNPSEYIKNVSHY